MTHRTRLGRLRAAVATASAAAAAPAKEVWLPVKDGGSEAPGHYPQPGGRMVLVRYAPDDPAAMEETA